MRLRHLLLPLIAAPLLSACVNDTATYQIDDTGEHTLSLIREQPRFWDNKVELQLVVTRMPDCMRRHSLGVGTASTRVEIYRVPSGAFIVKAGKRLFATETQTCESFAKIKEVPADGLGTLMGTFLVKGGTLAFVKAETPGAPAPSAQ